MYHIGRTDSGACRAAGAASGGYGVSVAGDVDDGSTHDDEAVMRMSSRQCWPRRWYSLSRTRS